MDNLSYVNLMGKVASAGGIIDGILKRRRMAAAELARLIDMDGDLLRKKIKGQRKFAPEELKKIADTLQVPIASLLGEEIKSFQPSQPLIVIPGGLQESLKIPETEFLSVPLVSWDAAAAYPEEFPVEFVTGIICINKSEFGTKEREYLRAVKITKDNVCLEPIIKPGDTVLIDTEEKDIEDMGIYALKWEGKYLLRRARIRKGDKFVIFVSETHEEEPVAVLTAAATELLIGRVIGALVKLL